MIEPEIAFAELQENMNLAEAMVKYIIRYVLENYPEEMEFFNKFIDKGLLDRLQNILDSEFVAHHLYGGGGHPPKVRTEV